MTCFRSCPGIRITKGPLSHRANHRSAVEPPANTGARPTVRSPAAGRFPGEQRRVDALLDDLCARPRTAARTVALVTGAESVGDRHQPATELPGHSTPVTGPVMPSRRVNSRSCRVVIHGPRPHSQRRMSRTRIPTHGHAPGTLRQWSSMRPARIWAPRRQNCVSGQRISPDSPATVSIPVCTHGPVRQRHIGVVCGGMRCFPKGVVVRGGVLEPLRPLPETPVDFRDRFDALVSRIRLKAITL